jgi:hypothetical protein
LAIGGVLCSESQFQNQKAKTATAKIRTLALPKMAAPYAAFGVRALFRPSAAHAIPASATNSHNKCIITPSGILDHPF